MKVRAVPGDVEKAFPTSCPDTNVQVWRQLLLLAPAASALLTKCNSLPMPRFRQTCGSKYRTPCGGRSAKRGLL